jgi:hypothetical protein
MTFQKGEKWQGNPTGRPLGTGHRQQLFKNLVEPHKEALLDTAIKLALGGSEAMLRLFLERMLPPRPTDDTVTINLPDDDIKKAGALLTCGENILKAVAQCEVTPQQAKILMGSLEVQRKHIETCELTDRVTAIEKILMERK